LGLIHAVSGSRGKRKEKKREGNVYFSSFFLVILYGLLKAGGLNEEAIPE
jgi:hypothetical protein